MASNTFAVREAKTIMTDELLKNCLDEQGRVKVWPKKHARKDAVIQYLAEKFEYDRVYTEKEVNALLDEWHTFGDYFLLRRSLIEYGLLTRDAYGREYRRIQKD